METKLIELRDKGTCIPLLCIKPDDTLVPVEKLVGWRYGFKDSDAVIVLHMGEPGRGATYDPHSWNDRTYFTAHLHIQNNWDKLKTGDLDVRVLLGEEHNPCESEFL